MSTDVAIPADELSDADRIELLEQQLADATVRAEKAEELAEAHSPTRDIGGFIMTSIEDVEHRFDKQNIRDLAEAELAEINRARLKNGYMPINYSDEEWAVAIEKVKSDLLLDREKYAPPAEGPLMRTLKMVTPAGNLVQIPYEPQINNQAGSLEDGIAIYRNKGFKLPKPMLCPSQDCYEYSAVNDNDGNYTFKAYCTKDHHDRTERVQGQSVENVVTARVNQALQGRR